MGKFVECDPRRAPSMKDLFHGRRLLGQLPTSGSRGGTAHLHRTGVNVASFALAALRDEGVRGRATQAPHPRLRALLRAVGDAPLGGLALRGYAGDAPVSVNIAARCVSRCAPDADHFASLTG